MLKRHMALQILNYLDDPTFRHDLVKVLRYP